MLSDLQSPFIGRKEPDDNPILYPRYNDISEIVLVSHLAVHSWFTVKSIAAARGLDLGDYCFLFQLLTDDVETLTTRRLIYSENTARRPSYSSKSLTYPGACQ